MKHTFNIALVFILSILFATTANAKDPLDKIYIDAHITSLHQSPDGFDFEGVHYNTNQNNYGIGITIPAHFSNGSIDPNMSYRFGAFNNSYSDLSLYATIDIHSAYTNGFGIGVIMGAVSGYGDAPETNSLIPAIVPHVHYIHNNYKTEIGLLNSKYNPALTLTISYSF